MGTIKRLSLSQVTGGFLFYKRAAGRAQSTLDGYHYTFEKLRLFFPDDPQFAAIDRARMVEFFAWLQNEHITAPVGFAPRPSGHLAPKSIYNIYVNLKALWAWACREGYADCNPVQAVDVPDYKQPAIEPFTKDEIKAILKACQQTAEWRDRPGVVAQRQTANRDTAIILVLLDTGIRASELCNLAMSDVNLGNNRLCIRHGKGNKERYVSFGKGTARAMWKYITPLAVDRQPTDPFFMVDDEGTPRPFTRDVLHRLIVRLGERAGLQTRCHPHRFRHTFAITYLRNDGDVFTLQEQLGHTDLTMVRRYLRLARADVAEAHRRASPVDNWRL